MKNIVFLIISMSCFNSYSQWVTSGSKTTTTNSIGIGTDNPKSKLHLANLKTGEGLKLGEKGMFRISSLTNNHIVLENKTTNGNLYIRSNSASEKIGNLILNDYGGNIGIGTSSPNQALVVKGNIAFDYNGSSFSGVKRNGVTTEYYNTITGANANIIHQFTGTDKTIMSLTQGGNIGIGINKPKSKLHLADLKTGEGLMLGEKGMFRISTASNNHIVLENKTTNGNLYIRSNSASEKTGNLILNDYGGNVGIGTTTTGSHRLAVEGSIGAREIKVQASGWSDFVFYEDYKLPTLKEVEAHINEKGHLKDIPSAAEVEKEGLYLGNMNAKLLQKIEELTLYTIQQEKKIEDFKEKEDIQEAKIEMLLKRLEKLEAKM